MLKSLSDGLVFVDERMRLRCKESLGEALVDVLHGLFRWMEHVGSVETVVAQLVVHDFVGREIGDRRWCLLCVFAGCRLQRKRLCVAYELVGGQQQGSLGELTAVESVLGVADGADGDDDVRVRIGVAQQSDGLLQVVSALFDRQFFFAESAEGRFWQLSTISPVCFSTYTWLVPSVSSATSGAG